MSEKITLTKLAFVTLLDYFPDPDDPGPYGPIGPIIRALEESWVLRLGPQPDPWRSGPSPIPWRLGPRPEPWRSALIARAVIDRAVAQFQAAEALQSKGAMEAVRSQIRDFADDYCGTRPPKWPWPGPWPPKFDTGQIRPLDLLVAGAQFQKAAGLTNPLQTDFSAAADQLFETGLNRLEGRPKQ